MAIEVVTKDCTQLSDAELAEMADICAEAPSRFEVGLLSKQVEAWVLVTLARDAGLKGFSFCTLERIGGTPSVLIAARGLSQTTYGLIFGLNALGMVVLSQFNRRWLTRHHPLRLLRRALRVQAAATALGLGLACFMPLPLPVLWGVLLCYIAPVSLVGGNSTVLAMARHGQHAGKAAAVNGMVTMAVGGLGASLVGLLHDGTERPLLLLMCLASLGAVALVHLLPPAADGAPADAN
jgi:DHA1 family bicyclomycin/chloramphenicol resistance-like MFS transporter